VDFPTGAFSFLIPKILLSRFFLASGQGVEGFKGRKHLAREPKQSPAALFVKTEPSRKIAFTFFVFARADFFP
jgi:hypothetical protein